MRMRLKRRRNWEGKLKHLSLLAREVNPSHTHSFKKGGDEWGEQRRGEERRGKMSAL